MGGAAGRCCSRCALSLALISASRRFCFSSISAILRRYRSLFAARFSLRAAAAASRSTFPIRTPCLAFFDVRAEYAKPESVTGLSA